MFINRNSKKVNSKAKEAVIKFKSRVKHKRIEQEPLAAAATEASSPHSHQLEQSPSSSNKNKQQMEATSATTANNNKKISNSKKKIKIKDDNQLLGAIYNSLVRNDTDNEGHVCFLEEVGIFLNYSKNTDSKVSKYDKLETGILIPSNVYIQHKRMGCITECFYSTLQMRVAQFFKTMDLDYSLKLSYREFKTGLNDLILNNRFQKIEKSMSDYCYSSIEETAMQNLFIKFDTDRDGFISFEEWIKCIRMPMCQTRINKINEAFNKLDRNKDGIIDLYDVKYWYINTANSYGNLRLINDKINESIKDWMETFNINKKNNDAITRDQWLDYYMIISSCVAEDAYFDLLMRTCFDL